MPALMNCRAATHTEIFHLLADAADDPVLARLSSDGAIRLERATGIEPA